MYVSLFIYHHTYVYVYIDRESSIFLSNTYGSVELWGLRVCRDVGLVFIDVSECVILLLHAPVGLESSDM